jgi:hypothetical protein
MLLLGHEDQAEPPFADLLQQFVGTDDRAQTLAERLVGGGQLRIGLKKSAGPFVG